MTNVTDKEKMVLEAILNSEYGEGKYSVDQASVWVNCLWTPNEKLGEKAVGGVLTSLQNKGFVVVNNGGTDESCCGLTEAGYEALTGEKL
jgi:hypothetical protein